MLVLVCKENNAISVRRIMPREASHAPCCLAIIGNIESTKTCVTAQKGLDSARQQSIIVFTNKQKDFPRRYGRKRCQAPDAPTAGHVESAPERRARRTVPPGRVLRRS